MFNDLSWKGFGNALQTASPMLMGMAQSLRSGQGVFGAPAQQGVGVMRQQQQREEDIGYLSEALRGNLGGGGAQTPMASVISGGMDPMGARNAAMSEYGGPTNAAADALSATNLAPSGPDPFNLRQVAAQAGLPESYLHQMAIKESGMRPNARNPNSSASGLFQFIDSTARQYGVNNRDGDPADDIQGILRYTQDSVEALTPVLGRTPDERELYLAHQQGQAGARRLLSNPNARAVDIVGADAVRLNGGRTSMTAQQFANHVMDYYGPNRSQQRAAPAQPAAQPASGGQFPVRGEQLGQMARQVTGADYDPEELLRRAQSGDTAAQALYQQIVQMGGAAPGGPETDVLSGGAGNTAARGQQGGDQLSATLSTQGTGGGLSEDEARRLATVLTSPNISPAAQQLLMQRYFPPDQTGYRMLTPAEVQGFGLPEGSYQMGGDGRISAIGGGGVTVNNNMGPTGIDYGEPEAGLVWRRDQQGNVMLDERGAPIAVPYQGGSVYRNQREAEQEADRAETKTEERRRQERLKLGTTLTSIGLNIAEIEDGGMPVAGRGGDFARTRVGRFLLGNDATDFENRTNQITTSAALSEVQNMRDNSPTGGAVGSLTDGEREALGNSVTALNSSTSPEEYARAARAYRDLAINIALKRPDGSVPDWRLVEDDDGNVSVEMMDGPGQAAPADPAAAPAAPAAQSGQAAGAPPMPDAFAQDQGVQEMARSFGMTPAELWSSAGDQEYWDAWLN